jgi:hypothetical protein
MPRARRIAVVLVVRQVAELRVGSHGLLIEGRANDHYAIEAYRPNGQSGKITSDEA